MNKKIAGLIIAVTVVIIILGVAAGLLMRNEQPKYAGVYLSTGDVFFGKLDMFPIPRLINPYTVQRSSDQNGNISLSLVSLSDAVWSPAPIMYLNSKNVVYWAPIQANSEIAKMMDNPQEYQAKLQEQQRAYQQQMQQQAQQPTSSTAPSDNKEAAPKKQ